ncbi:hypothetical protein ICN41_11230, partial [Polynucleobacter sp. 15G-AUS-farblos]|uniref:condensation domain-containing protein n=1 Tax=Polynucleobacter sp. 15G-AUS-farblos TaxID=2689094 RepID=UPI001C0BAC2B
DLAQPFNLEQGPLIRARLAALGEQEYALLISNHHLILDGWSTPILLTDLTRLYQAQRTGTPAGLAPAFAWREHLLWLAKQDRAAAQQYWQTHL